jgi:hypothetical protein
MGVVLIDGVTLNDRYVRDLGLTADRFRRQRLAGGTVDAPAVRGEKRHAVAFAQKKARELQEADADSCGTAVTERLGTDQKDPTHLVLESAP